MFTISFHDSNIPTPFNSFNISEELTSTNIDDCTEQIERMTHELIATWRSVVTGESDLLKDFHET